MVSVKECVDNKISIEELDYNEMLYRYRNNFYDRSLFLDKNLKLELSKIISDGGVKEDNSSELFLLKDINGNRVLDFDTVLKVLIKSDNKDIILSSLYHTICINGDFGNLYDYELEMRSKLKKCIDSGNDLTLLDGFDLSKGYDISDEELLEQLNDIKKYRFAKEIMILSNMGLVVFVAKKYSNRGLDLEELIQEGIIGLLKAIEKFDYSKSCVFSTYSVWWIRMRINRAVSDFSRVIQIPVYLQEFYDKMIKVSNELLLEFGRVPTDKEISFKMGVSISEYLNNKSIIEDISILSLDMSHDSCDEDGMRFGDFIEDVKNNPCIYQKIIEDEDEVFRLLKLLNDRDAKIMRMRYGIAPYDRIHTLKEVSLECGMCVEGVRKAEARIIKTLGKVNK